MTDQAYPRRCGEHGHRRLGAASVSGLPPQVRGAHTLGVEIETLTGLTPAGAGSTNERQMRRHERTAYPRRCGEHVIAATRLGRPKAYPRRCGEHRRVERRQLDLAGLPPQVRGAPPCQTDRP